MSRPLSGKHRNLISCLPLLLAAAGGCQGCEVQPYQLPDSGARADAVPDAALADGDLPDAGSTCGDGVRAEDEACDGLDLNGMTCVDLGYASGTLDCLWDCAFDAFDCSWSETCRDGVLDPLEGCDDGNAIPWDGCTGCQITEFRVSDDLPFEHLAPAVAAAADGRFVVVWQKCLCPWGNCDCDVKGRRYDALGQALSPEFSVPDSPVPEQGGAALGAAADGRFVVLWENNDPNLQGIYAQRYAADGTLAGGIFRASQATSFGQSDPAVAVSADGSFIATWNSYGQDGDSYGVFARRFLADGSPDGDEVQVNQHTAGNQSGASVALDPDGTAVQAWRSDGQDGDGYGVFARRLLPDGTPAAGEFQVNVDPQGNQWAPSVALLASGGFVVAWGRHLWEGPDGYDVFARVFAADAVPLGNEFQVHTSDSHSEETKRVAALPAGGFLVVWTSVPVQGVFGVDVLGRFFDDLGSPTGPEFQVNVYPNEESYGLDLAVAGDGSFVVVWSGRSPYGQFFDVFAQRFDHQGAPLGVGP